MQTFIGVHDCKIDDKGRLMVPAPLKRQLTPFAEQKFVVKRSTYGTCLELYIMSEWKEVEKKINSLNAYKRDVAKLRRVFYAGVKEVEMDTTGRMLLAKDLLAFSGITKDVVMAATGNFIEIWDKQKYEAEINLPGEEYESLFESVLGGSDSPVE